MDKGTSQVYIEITKYFFFSVSTYPQPIIILLNIFFLIKNRLDNNKMSWIKLRVKSLPLQNNA